MSRPVGRRRGRSSAARRVRSAGTEARHRRRCSTSTSIRVRRRDRSARSRRPPPRRGDRRRTRWRCRCRRRASFSTRWWIRSVGRLARPRAAACAEPASGGEADPVGAAGAGDDPSGSSCSWPSADSNSSRRHTGTARRISRPRRRGRSDPTGTVIVADVPVPRPPEVARVPPAVRRRDRRSWSTWVLAVAPAATSAATFNDEVRDRTSQPVPFDRTWCRLPRDDPDDVEWRPVHGDRHLPRRRAGRRRQPRSQGGSAGVNVVTPLRARPTGGCCS